MTGGKLLTIVSISGGQPHALIVKGNKSAHHVQDRRRANLLGCRSTYAKPQSGKKAMGRYIVYNCSLSEMGPHPLNQPIGLLARWRIEPSLVGKLVVSADACADRRVDLSRICVRCYAEVGRGFLLVDFPLGSSRCRYCCHNPAMNEIVILTCQFARRRPPDLARNGRWHRRDLRTLAGGHGRAPH